MPRHAAASPTGNRAKPRSSRLVLPAALAVVVLGIVGTAVLLEGPQSPSPTALMQDRPSPSVSVSRTGGAQSPVAQAQSAGAQSLAAQSKATHSPVSPASAPAGRIESPPGTDPAGEIAALTSGLPAGGVSVAGLNLSTGASFSYGAGAGMVMGSTAKLDILEVLLLQHQDTDTLLDDDTVNLATSMIENSDNDAADSLWSDVGSDPAVTAANQRLGVPNLVAGTDGYWGLGTTGAADQVTLLKNLVSTSSPIDAASRTFALGLMDDVEADQRWGVGVVADAGTTFANKNGWLAVDDDSDLWLTNSDGIVTVDGQQLLLSVLTQHNETEAAGIALVESIAEATAPALAR